MHVHIHRTVTLKALTSWFLIIYKNKLSLNIIPSKYVYNQFLLKFLIKEKVRTSLIKLFLKLRQRMFFVWQLSHYFVL